MVEVEELKNFILAEDYHQDYLVNNPKGYCHINPAKAYESFDITQYKGVPKAELKEKLTDIQYSVTQEDETEYPGTGEYNDFDEEGIYVDIVSGQPLFSSDDKFNAGCGWPSFSKTIESNSLTYRADHKLARERVEVRSRAADSHLGHVFEDGPIEKGGLRYCINSAALKFIPYSKMDEYGYSKYKVFVRRKNHEK